MPSPTDIPEITPEELARTLEQDASLQVLDIRAPARVATGRIDVVPDDRFRNIVGSRLAAMHSAQEIGLDPGRPVAVVCNTGNTSKPAAQHLQQLGFEARSVRGGMAAWMLMTLPRELPVPEGLDRLVQFDRVGKGALGYVLIAGGEALVIDPPRDVDPYLELIEEAGATLVGVADTHVHADYISGAPAMSRERNVPYYLHPRDAVYPYDGTPGRLVIEPLSDGSAIALGGASVRVQHTPGHTEGSVTFLVGGEAAFTGDFIFIESIGRPDLGGRVEEWAAELWESVARARDEWPRGTTIYPAHYAHESERNADRTIGSPFGDLPARSPMLALDDRDAFLAAVVAAEARFPDAYRQIKAINVGIQQVGREEADLLEVGRNECALGGT